ncbi:predicted protein, partial [Nematostella vectensis]
LGDGFYFSENDVLSSDLRPQGYTIAQNIPPHCITRYSRAESGEQSTYHRSTKEFYANFADSADLEDELRTDLAFKTSYDKVTKGLSAGNKDISGYSLKLYAYSHSIGICGDCLNNFPFSEDILEEFFRLPAKIKDPSLPLSWFGFGYFLGRTGTHVIKSVLYGKQIQQYAFAKSSARLRQYDFHIKACSSLKKESSGKLAPCRRIDKSDGDRLEFMSTTTVVRGGRVEQRADLLTGVNDENAYDFLSTINDDNISALEFKYKPIWDLLKIRFYGTEHYPKAKLLETYFKALKNFGCETTKIGYYVVQKMRYAPQSIPQNPSFQCVIRNKGCMTNNDCHYIWDKAYCSCNGP